MEKWLVEGSLVILVGTLWGVFLKGIDNDCKPKNVIIKCSLFVISLIGFIVSLLCYDITISIVIKTCIMVFILAFIFGSIFFESDYLECGVAAGAISVLVFLVTGMIFLDNYTAIADKPARTETIEYRYVQKIDEKNPTILTFSYKFDYKDQEFDITLVKASTRIEKFSISAGEINFAVSKSVGPKLLEVVSFYDQINANINPAPIIEHEAESVLEWTIVNSKI